MADAGGISPEQGRQIFARNDTGKFSGRAHHFPTTTRSAGR